MKRLPCVLALLLDPQKHTCLERCYSLPARRARPRDRRERGAGELHKHREGVRGGQAGRVRRAAREDRQAARGLGLRARAGRAGARQPRDGAPGRAGRPAPAAARRRTREGPRNHLEDRSRESSGDAGNYQSHGREDPLYSRV